MRKVLSISMSAVVLGLAIYSQTASAGEVDGRSAWASCRSISAGYVSAWEIKAKYLACSRARKVARKAAIKGKHSRGWSATTAKGFKCKRTGSYYDGIVITCKRGKLRVHFKYGA